MLPETNKLEECGLSGSEEWVAGFQAGQSYNRKRVLLEQQCTQMLVEQLNTWIVNNSVEEKFLNTDIVVNEVSEIVTKYVDTSDLGKGCDTEALEPVEGLKLDCERLPTGDPFMQAAAIVLTAGEEYGVLVGRLRALQQLVGSGSVSSKEIGEALARMMRELEEPSAPTNWGFHNFFVKPRLKREKRRQV